MNTPVLGFIAPSSNAGKTTLLTKLIAYFKDCQLKVGIIKHAHHSFDIDIPGKDSYRLRQAGADQVLIASNHRWAWMGERTTSSPVLLDELLSRLYMEQHDLILVEGFKTASCPKIEVHLAALNPPLLCATDDTIIAVASDNTTMNCQLPLLDLNNTNDIGQFILSHFHLPGTNHHPS